MASEKDKAKEAPKNEAKTTALAPRPQMQIGLVPATIDEAWRLAQALSRSAMVPKHFQGHAEDALVAVMWGAELGFKPMASLQNIAVINGRPSVWGDLALAIVMSHPDYEDHKEWEEGKPGSDEWTFFCTLKRKGKEPCTRKFSVADAKQAHLWMKKGAQGGETPWVTYPQRMLAMRARGWAMRDRFPDALKGLHVAEEALDMPTIENPDQPGSEIQMPRRVETVDAQVVGREATIEDMATGKVEEKLAGNATPTPPDGTDVPSAGNEGGGSSSGEPPAQDDMMAVMQEAQTGHAPEPEIIVEQNASVVRRDPIVEETPQKELTYEKAESGNKLPKGSSGAAYLGPVEKRKKPLKTLPKGYKQISGTQAAKIHKVLNAARAHSEEEFYQKLWLSWGIESTLEVPEDAFKTILSWCGGEALKVK